jgi:hypothetical protein
MPESTRPAPTPKLAHYGQAGLAAFVVWQVVDTPLSNWAVIGLAVAIMIVGALPVLNWAKKQSEGLPAFELMMLTFIPFYAIPLLRGHPATQGFGDIILIRSALAVLFFQLACVAGHRLVFARPSRNRMWTTPVLREDNIKLSRLGVYMMTLFVYLQTFTEVIPAEFLSILRALFFGIGTVSVFLVSRAWGNQRLSSADQFTLPLVFFVQTVIVASQLYLITIASTILMALIGYVTARKKVPLIFMGAVFICFAVLHNGKDEMREIYWSDAKNVDIELAALPDFFGQWIEYGLQQNDEDEQRVTAGILERASLFQIMCTLVAQSPEKQPYLSGETYRAIPMLVVPRILWPNKPRPHESNIRLAISYGFVSERSAERVSIAFGIPSEAYANFGFIGVVLVGFGMGAMFKKIGVWGQNASPISLAGLAQVLLIAWSFQAEMTLAVWLSSLYQASVALLGIPWAYRYFTGR